MKIPVYNIEFKSVEEFDLPEALFNLPWNDILVHQAIITHQANARNSVAHAKDRSETRGGGRKPWRQKGTGRARHGSIRSPLWKGGGVTFGPDKEKNYTKKLNKKMKEKALRIILSRQAEEGNIYIIDSFPEKETMKTKEMVSILKSFMPERGRTLVVFSDDHKAFHRSIKNIEKVSYSSPQSLNVYETAIPSRIIFEKKALEAFISTHSA